ncbi:MAG: T9SS type A sorting domain-containing protein [Chloroherpetonaceae bacterium]|nr:T9SS type A sorting domain-containing protein [Chloroherpetonaceae bacterium]
MRGNVTLGSSSRFVATRNASATIVPTVVLGGTAPSTVSVPVQAWWGTAGDEGNVRCNWQVPAGADVTLTSGSAIACMNTYSLTVNGILRCQDNSALIATLTGSATGLLNFVLGTNGRLTCADPDGLGDGTFLAPAPNQPLFVRQQAPSNPVPQGWNLASIQTNGTVEFNGSSAQAVDAGTYNNLVINNTAGNLTINFPETNPTPPPLSLGSPNVVTGNLTVNNLLDVQRGILVLTPATGSAPLVHQFGAVSLGSASSSANIVGVPADPPPLPQYYSFTTNTGIVVNNRANTTVTVTVNTNLSSTVAHNGVGFIIGGLDANPACITTITVNGNFNFPQELFLIGNARGSGGSGNVTNKILQVAGNFTMSNSDSRFIGDWFGFVSDPTIRLTGANATLTVPPVVWLGTKGETNALCLWDIPAGAQITIPNGSALVCMDNRAVTLAGTLICEDGAEVIDTQTGGASAQANFAMQPTGTLRIRDVHGLGTGLVLDPPSGAGPVFIRRTSPFSGTPFGWNLTSLNNNGTVIYDNASTTQAITPRNGTSTFAPNVQYHNLVISGLNKNLSGGSAVVGNTLTLSGGIVTVNATDTVRVTNAAPSSVVRTSGHINGRIKRAISTVSGSYLYPLGDAALYRPVTLQAQAAASGAALLGQLIPQPGSTVSSAYQSPLQGVSQLRHYQFTNTGTSNLDVTQATVQVNTDDGALNPPNTRVATILQGSTPFQWLNRGGSVSSVPNPITSDPFTETITTTNPNFYVALGTVNVSDNPLPVELVEFVGKATGLGVELRWKTASELNNAGFILLRNGEVVAHYREQAALQGAGTTPLGRAYRYLDEQVREGERYVYQLRSVDFDGTVHEYGWRVEVLGRRVSREFRLEQNYPNPFNPGTVIAFEVPEPAEVRLAVYDLLGREVARLVEGRREAGRYEVRFVASGLSGGIYIYRLEAVSGRGQYVESRKMVLMK